MFGFVDVLNVGCFFLFLLKGFKLICKEGDDENEIRGCLA